MKDRHRTKYPGVWFLIGKLSVRKLPRTGKEDKIFYKEDKIFYIDYRREGKRVENGVFDVRLFRDRQLVAYQDGRLGSEQEQGTGICRPAGEDRWSCRFGGIRLPLLPSIPCTSLPQIPQALTWINTSSSAISGSGTSSYTNLLYSFRTNAFIANFS